MKFVFDVTLMFALYLGGIFALNTDVTYVLTALGAGVAGSVVLAYFRRDRDHREIFFKSACASICGLVTGAIITKYYGVEATEYRLGVYFFSSLLSLFFIRGLLAVTEQNASGWIVTIIQRVLATNGVGDLKVTPPIEAPAVIKTDVVIEKKPPEKTEENK